MGGWWRKVRSNSSTARSRASHAWWSSPSWSAETQFHPKTCGERATRLILTAQFGSAAATRGETLQAAYRSTPRIVVIGAGPTGLGAAHRLRELGVDDY